MKAGNSHLRRALVEGNLAISRRNFDRKKPVEGQVVSSEVERLAAKANTRLLKRYRYLTEERGKTVNKAKTAVVNERIRWILIIGKTVKAELARGRPHRRRRPSQTAAPAWNRPSLPRRAAFRTAGNSRSLYMPKRRRETPIERYTMTKRTTLGSPHRRGGATLPGPEELKYARP